MPDRPNHDLTRSRVSAGGRPRRAAWWCALTVAVMAIFVPQAASAAEVVWDGWRVDASADATVRAGESITLTAVVSSNRSRSALVDLEVHDPNGAKVFQEYWDRVRFASGTTQVLRATWRVPPGAAPGRYTVNVGVFSAGWGTLYVWNSAADLIDVTAAAPPTSSSTTSTTSTTTTTSTSTTTTSTTTSTTTTSTTAPPTSSSTSSSTTTTPTTAAPQQPSGAQFVEDFTGNRGLERFRFGVFHRERDAFVPSHPEWVSTRSWLADHDTSKADCGDPVTNKHAVSTAQGDAASVYVCRDHLMTSMGDVSGYSVVWFSPRQTFSRVREVCWDVSVAIDVLEDRQWWEVMVVPASGPDVTAINWIAGTANLPSYGDAKAVVLGFGPDDPPHPKISVGDREPVRGPWPQMPAWGTATSSVATRVPHCFRDLGNGTLEYESQNANGTPWRFTAPGSFPAGPVKVVFKDHSYTPDKACGGTCKSYTWHWDNIRIS